MNSHDEGLLYAHMSQEDRARYTQRKIRVSDIADAMNNGFKAEPDLSPCHLPLLSDDALARVHAESEKWRDKYRERELEQELDQMRAAEATVSGYYVTLREIIGAMHVPHGWRGIMGLPQHVAWTEQVARELVAKADKAGAFDKAARLAEERVDLLERYVTNCDEKRLPYNWNVFRMPNGHLRDFVRGQENMEKLTRCDCNAERVAWFETRVQQETEQSLRWHTKRGEALRSKIQALAATGRIPTEIGQDLLDALTGREKPDSEGWIVWEWGYKPHNMPDDALVDIMLHNGAGNTLEAGVVEWSDVKQYRRAK